MSFAMIALLFAGSFLLILFSLHFLEPKFDPSWRMISEYEIGKFGWLMRIAFFCWAGAMLFTLLAIWPVLASLSGWVTRVWFSLFVLALIGAGIFTTNPITGAEPNLADNLHKVCGSVVILTFPIATLFATRSLLLNPDLAHASGLLIALTALTWLSMFAYFASIIAARRKDPNAGTGDSHILMGWPNRIMVVCYIAWLVGVAALLL